MIRRYIPTGSRPGKEIITPSVFTDLLVAKSIRAEKIEGLEFIQTGLATNENQFQNLGARLDELDAKLAGLSLTLAGSTAPDGASRASA